MKFIRATEVTVPILSQVLSQNSNKDSEQIIQLLYSINTYDFNASLYRRWT